MNRTLSRRPLLCTTCRLGRRWISFSVLQCSDVWNTWLFSSAALVSTPLACLTGVIFRVFTADTWSKRRQTRSEWGAPYRRDGEGTQNINPLFARVSCSTPASRLEVWKRLYQTLASKMRKNNASDRTRDMGRKNNWDIRLGQGTSLFRRYTVSVIRLTFAFRTRTSFNRPYRKMSILLCGPIEEVGRSC